MLILCVVTNAFACAPINKAVSTTDSVMIFNADTITEQLNQQRILELKREVVDLTQIIADTKESFYNTRIYLWGFIIGAITLLIVLVGFVGVQSIRHILTEIKGDVESSKTNSNTSIKEIKEDLLKRVDDLKTDLRDFKLEQQRQFDKFEALSSEKIDKGLESAFQDAVNKIMKGTYGQVVDELQEQIAAIKITIDELKSNQSYVPRSSSVETGRSEPVVAMKPSNNAFDAQS